MSPDPESISDKLKSLGVRLGTSHLQPQAPKASKRHERGIEHVIDGYDLETPYGVCFVREEHYAVEHVHGQLTLCQECGLDILSTWGGTPHMSDPSLQNIVFLDTETSGLAGGTGTYAFLVGIGYHTLQGFHLVQFFMRDPGQEAALLAALAQWLQPFEVLVTFNGKTFDVPLLNTRYILNGLGSPVQEYEHLDLLQVARKLWRDRLPSRALGELEKEIVQFYRTGEDIPGWLIPQMYFDYLRNGDAQPLAGIFYHNAMDILSLAALFGYVANLLKEPVRYANGSGLDLAAIARMYEQMGWLELAADLYERSIDHGLDEPFYIKTIERYALLRRKQGQWDQAVQLWAKSAERGDWSACVELAKYYEHRSRDYSQALTWTQRALDLLDRHFQFESTRRVAETDLIQRMTRISRKLSNHRE